MCVCLCVYVAIHCINVSMKYCCHYTSFSYFEVIKIGILTSIFTQYSPPPPLCDIGEQEEFVPAHRGRIRKAQSKQMRLTSLEDPWRKNLPPHNKPTGRKNRKLIKQVGQVSRQSLARDNKHKVRRFLNYLPRLPPRPPGKVVFESSPAFISVLIATCL